MLVCALYSFKIMKWQQQLLTVVLQAAETGAALLRMLGAEILTAAYSFISASRLHTGGGTARGVLHFHFIFPALLRWLSLLCRAIQSSRCQLSFAFRSPPCTATHLLCRLTSDS